MNISDVNSIQSHRSDNLRNSNVGNSGQVDSSAAGSGSSTETRPSGDRVEISADARAALQDKRSSELTFARRALDNVPSMSEERVAELTNRIKSGYYSQPDVLDQVARRAGGELASGR